MEKAVAMGEFETLDYRVTNGVAWITMNRPEVHNAFNLRMQDELRAIWRSARHDDDVRCLVLTGAGERAFCVGIDRAESMGDWADEEGESERPRLPGRGSEDDTPWHFDDLGENLGPKTNDLWKPVIAAVNGMACGGAFYMLGEADVVIAADGAVFFDPHVTFGMMACFESIHMLQKMPFHEVMRMALAGSHERMSAQRAFDIGFVTEVVPLGELHAAAARLAEAIASQPPIAVQGTVRSIWVARDLGRKDALDVGKIIIRAGSDPRALVEGQEAFASGKRITPHIR